MLQSGRVQRHSYSSVLMSWVNRQKRKGPLEVLAGSVGRRTAPDEVCYRKTQYNAVNDDLKYSAHGRVQ